MKPYWVIKLNSAVYYYSPGVWGADVGLAWRFESEDDIPKAIEKEDGFAGFFEVKKYYMKGFKKHY